MAGKRRSKISIPVMILIVAILASASPMKSIELAFGERWNAQLYRQNTQYHLIKVVQRKLIERGYYQGPVDGVNGPETKEAIKKYQRDHGLKVDGIPGPKTLKSLGF